MSKVDIIIGKSIVNEVKRAGKGIQITNRNNKHTLDIDKSKKVITLFDDHYEDLFYKTKQNLHIYNS